MIGDHFLTKIFFVVVLDVIAITFESRLLLETIYIINYLYSPGRELAHGEPIGVSNPDNKLPNIIRTHSNKPEIYQAN